MCNGFRYQPATMIILTDQEEYGWHGFIWTNAMLELCCFRKSCWPFAQPKPPWKPSRKRENGHWTAGICRETWWTREFFNHLPPWIRMRFEHKSQPKSISSPLPVVASTVFSGQRRSECRSSPWTSRTCHRRTTTCCKRIKIARPKQKAIPAPHATTWNIVKLFETSKIPLNSCELKKTDFDSQPCASLIPWHVRSWILGSIVWRWC